MKKLQLVFTVACIFCLIVAISACNTTGVTPANYSRIKVVNTLAGSSPFNFFLNATTVSKPTITFPASSGYVSATPGTKFFQVSLATTPSLYFYSTTFTMTDSSSYSVFVTGGSPAYTSIITKDTLTTPPLGKAKIRFVNTSSSAGPLDVTINAVSGFRKIAYKGVTGFIEIPAGTYEFKAYQTGSSSTLATLSSQVLSDGTVYTLYSAGIVGSTASNSVFQLALMSNLLPAKK